MAAIGSESTAVGVLKAVGVLREALQTRCCCGCCAVLLSKGSISTTYTWS
jgi:hypothetical protein